MKDMLTWLYFESYLQHCQTSRHKHEDFKCFYFIFNSTLIQNEVSELFLKWHDVLNCITCTSFAIHCLLYRWFLQLCELCNADQAFTCYGVTSQDRRSFGSLRATEGVHSTLWTLNFVVVCTLQVQHEPAILWLCELLEDRTHDNDVCNLSGGLTCWLENCVYVYGEWCTCVESIANSTPH